MKADPCWRERVSMAIWRARSTSFLYYSLRSARSFTPAATAAAAAVRGCSTCAVQPHLEKVGFIGLGNMGFHMANNLINAGYKVTVHDINHNAMEKFLERGVPTKETPFDIAESSDVVITMLPSSTHPSSLPRGGEDCQKKYQWDPDACGKSTKQKTIMGQGRTPVEISGKLYMKYGRQKVLDVYTGTNGLLHGKSPLRPWLFIDSSTVDPLTSRSISKEISKCSLEAKKGETSSPVMLDAPVSGGVPGAEAGTLTFMVGGLQEAFLAARPLFLSMGRRTIYCGATGNGSAAKICNNLAMAVNMVGVSEAFALGQRLGITASTLTDIFNSSSARCWSSDSYNPVPGVMDAVPASRGYNGGFSSKLMAKDLALAIASAEEVGLSCAVGLIVREIYMDLCKEGHESKDFSCVFRHYYSGKDEL